MALVCFQSVCCCHRHHGPPTHTHTRRYITLTAGQRSLCIARCLCVSAVTQLMPTTRLKESSTLRWSCAHTSICDARCIPAVVLWLSVAICSFARNHSSTRVGASLRFPDWPQLIPTDQKWTCCFQLVVCRWREQQWKHESVIYSYQEKVSHSL